MAAAGGGGSGGGGGGLGAGGDSALSVTSPDPMLGTMKLRDVYIIIGCVGGGVLFLWLLCVGAVLLSASAKLKSQHDQRKEAAIAAAAAALAPPGGGGSFQSPRKGAPGVGSPRSSALSSSYRPEEGNFKSPRPMYESGSARGALSAGASPRPSPRPMSSARSQRAASLARASPVTLQFYDTAADAPPAAPLPGQPQAPPAGSAYATPSKRPASMFPVSARPSPGYAENGADFESVTTPGRMPAASQTARLPSSSTRNAVAASPSGAGPSEGSPAVRRGVSAPNLPGVMYMSP